MEYEIKLVEKRMIAGFHMVGPWEQTVKQGFEQLMKWVDGKQIVPLEWIAVYYDNPDVAEADGWNEAKVHLLTLDDLAVGNRLQQCPLRLADKFRLFRILLRHSRFKGKHGELCGTTFQLLAQIILFIRRQRASDGVYRIYKLQR